jgi:Ni/Co efflux regulator RcnB
MKRQTALILLLTFIFTCAPLVRAQDATQTPQDASNKNAQRQAERDRKEAERKRKEEEKAAQNQAGVRCSRLGGKH